MMRKFLLLLLALFVIISVVLWIPWKKSFVFIHNETGEQAAYLPVKEITFQINYTHSIHLSDVIERYEVTAGNTLRLTELEYEDFAIGMPSNAGEGEVFVEQNGKYFIKNMNREFKNFRLFVGDVEAGLFLLTDGRQYDLKKFLERGESYTFRIQKLSLLEQLKGVNIDEQ